MVAKAKIMARKATATTAARPGGLAKPSRLPEFEDLPDRGGWAEGARSARARAWKVAVPRTT